jgi:hypothetical protein
LYGSQVASRGVRVVSRMSKKSVASEPDVASPGGTFYPTVRAAGAATPRTSLDLLGLPYPFSQVGLLTASQFAELATQRRNRADQSLPPVNEQTLQELHRDGVLVPLFRVDLTPRPDGPTIDISDSLTARHVHTTYVGELFRGAAEGRVSDPAASGFEPWSTERRRPRPWRWCMRNHRAIFFLFKRKSPQLSIQHHW